MENYSLEFMIEILKTAVLSGFLISCIPFLIGVGIHGILKIFKKI
jgi:hypothetical protein